MLAYDNIDWLRWDIDMASFDGAGACRASSYLKAASP